MNPANTNFSDLRSALSAWYRESQRALPWRTDPSVYRTVVSEFMCQQTQIDTATVQGHQEAEQRQNSQQMDPTNDSDHPTRRS